MKAYLYLTLLVVPALALPAQGSIFSKRSHHDPDKRVPELISILRGDPDEAKRIAAACELREYDPHAYPEIVPVLLDVLDNDTRPGVRREAAASLGRIRPIETSTAVALQKAASHDPSLRVRIQAWCSLQTYHFSPHTTRPKDASAKVTTAPAPGFSGEPPLDDPHQPGTAAGTPSMQIPPLPAPNNSLPRPLPLGRAGGRVIPGQPVSSPGPAPVEAGPVLVTPH
jgi:hypothetical protein